MIATLSGRRCFERLRARGVRRGKGPITVISRRCADQDPRVAFAISRGVGGSVRRTRTKRRLRHVVAELAVSQGEALAGDHLIRVHSSIEHWSHGRLVDTMSELLSSSPGSAAESAAELRESRQ